MAPCAEMSSNTSLSFRHPRRERREIPRCCTGLGREIAAFDPRRQIGGRGVRSEKSTWRRVCSPLSGRGLGLFSSCLTGMGWSHRALTWTGALPRETPKVHLGIVCVSAGQLDSSSDHTPLSQTIIIGAGATRRFLDRMNCHSDVFAYDAGVEARLLACKKKQTKG